MHFDTLITNPGRLRILAALAAGGGREFVELRAATRLTDGNLSSHARRLAGAGVIRIDKSFRDGKPLTTLTLTPEGQRRLAEHIGQLVAMVSPNPTGQGSATVETFEEEWVD